MAGGGEAGVDLSRKFVSEAELDKRRQKRQEEWQKVRKPDDPESKNRINFVSLIIPSYIVNICYTQVYIYTYIYIHLIDMCMYQGIDIYIYIMWLKQNKKIPDLSWLY